jgi:hypothetical protein
VARHFRSLELRRAARRALCAGYARPTRPTPPRRPKLHFRAWTQRLRLAWAGGRCVRDCGPNARVPRDIHSSFMRAPRARAGFTSATDKCGRSHDASARNAAAHPRRGAPHCRTKSGAISTAVPRQPGRPRALVPPGRTAGTPATPHHRQHRRSDRRRAACSLKRDCLHPARASRGPGPLQVSASPISKFETRSRNRPLMRGGHCELAQQEAEVA